MDADLKLACAIAEALTRGKTSEEIARMQVTAQTVASLLASELACLKTKNSTLPSGGARK